MLPVIVHSVNELRAMLPENKHVALTPTMGALHEGHLSLVRHGRQLADINVVSVYVNPLQFGPHEDFSTYPRELEADCARLENIADIVFAPNDAELYPLPQTVTITLPPLADELCGRSRPGFFQGVATVVCKLLNCVRPQTAIFGKKDFQQLFLVQLMVAQLNFPTKIAAMPILREADGLAMSSRNAYLTSDERQRAVLLPNALRTAAAAITAGEKPTTAAATVRQQLQADGFVVDYVECRNATTLTSTASGDIVLLVAATLGQTRLIDNIEIRCPNAAKRELA